MDHSGGYSSFASGRPADTELETSAQESASKKVASVAAMRTGARATREEFREYKLVDSQMPTSTSSPAHLAQEDQACALEERGTEVTTYTTQYRSEGRQNYSKGVRGAMEGYSVMEQRVSDNYPAEYTGKVGNAVEGQESTEVRSKMTGNLSAPRFVKKELMHELRKVVSVVERVDESRSRIVSEQIVEREVRVPMRVTRQDVVEKIVVIPETRIIKEEVERAHKVRERIVERTKPTIRETVYSVPEVTWLEVEEEKLNVVPRFMGEPEKIVKRVPNYKRREVPEYVDVIVKVDRPVPKIVEVSKIIARKRPIPVTVEAEYEYRLPQLRPVYTKKYIPMTIPRFIEIPVAREMLSTVAASTSERLLQQVSTLAIEQRSLCEIEVLAADIRAANEHKDFSPANAQSAVLKAWDSGTLRLDIPPVTAQ